MKASKKQVEKFKKVARELECAQDEITFDETLSQIAKQKPSKKTMTPKRKGKGSQDR